MTTRLSAARRGYDHNWNSRIRPAQLAREPLCRFCRERGRIRAAVEVDHIDGNSRNNDPANLRSLCKSCHSRRTAQDQGFAASGSFYPQNIRKAGSPVTIVAGPPCAGKTTWIKENAAPSDLIVDWDNIALAVVGVPMHSVPDNRIMQVVMVRNKIISGLHGAKGRDMIWLEDRAPQLWQRQHWVRSLGGRVVVLETPPEVCIARVARTQSRAARPGADAAPEAWWGRYTVDYTDTRIR